MSPRYPNFVLYVSIPLFLITFIVGITNINIDDLIPENSRFLMIFYVVVIFVYLLSLGLTLEALSTSESELKTASAITTLLLPFSISSFGMFQTLSNLEIPTIICWIFTIAYFIFQFTIFKYKE